MSYWFIIGTAPPVRVFMCIHVFCLLSQVLNEFDMSRTRTGYGFTGTCHHGKNVSTHQICSQNPVNSVELMNSLTEHVKSWVVVCWDVMMYCRDVLLCSQ